MITPWESAISPASVTTNDGTPNSATNDPWNPPITTPVTSASRIAMSPGQLVTTPGQLELRDDDGRRHH